MKKDRREFLCEENSSWQVEASRNGRKQLPKMVQHNDKWKKKATREYHRKHGTQPAGRGRGRGRGIVQGVPEQEGPVEQHETQESAEGDSSDESNEGSEDETKETRKERSKYARRKIESNAWRFESEETDSYLGTSLSKSIPLIAVIDESALEPPEPDYAHLPARPFEPAKPPRLQGRKKNLSIKESDLAPLKAQIDKANAARAFKERFSSGQKGNVLIIDEEGTARKLQRSKEEEDVDDEIDDIDTFLNELDMQDRIFPFK